MNQPEPGWITHAKIKRVIDGDTLEVSIERTVNVRLKDFLASELNTAEGVSAKQTLKEILTKDECILFIPSENPQKLLDFNSFNRAVGIIWQDGQDIRQLMVDKGAGKWK